MISLRVALILYAVLAAIALATLKAQALTLSLIIIAALVVKSVLHQYRSRL